MANYFDVFISGSPKDSEIFPSGDDKARMYLEKFFNTPEDECHSCDFYVDAIVNEKVVYYSLLFRRNVIGTRTNGYFALTIRIKGGYHLNIGLMQHALYYIYERYVDGKIIEEKEENKIKSYKYKVESLSNFFTKENKESIKRFLEESFKDTSTQLVIFDSNKIPFSKTPSGNRNLYVASTSNDILLAELAKTWTLHTYLDYDKIKKLENQIDNLRVKLTNTQSYINKLERSNSELVSLKNELETTKTDRDSKVTELKSIKDKAKQFENEINNLRNNPKDLFERDVRKMLTEILDSQKKILTNKIDIKDQYAEEQKTLFPKLIISWSITLISVIGILIMGLNSGDAEDVEDIEKLKSNLTQTEKTIIDLNNANQKLEEKNARLKDSLEYYRNKMDKIGNALKQDKKSAQHQSSDSKTPNYYPYIGNKSNKEFKVGNSYPVSFKNGEKYEWIVDGEGAEKDGDNVKIVSKKPFTIVVKNGGSEVNQRNVSENKIVEK